MLFGIVTGDVRRRPIEQIQASGLLFPTRIEISVREGFFWARYGAQEIEVATEGAFYFGRVDVGDIEPEGVGYCNAAPLRLPGGAGAGFPGMRAVDKVYTRNRILVGGVGPGTRAEFFVGDGVTPANSQALNIAAALPGVPFDCIRSDGAGSHADGDQVCIKDVRLPVYVAGKMQGVEVGNATRGIAFFTGDEYAETQRGEEKCPFHRLKV